ncbi:MAG: subtilisin-like protein serine protease [candidate division Kazan bacterium GW2011_GWA1_50_15]|uniref:GLUG domain protein n=2 Tax=Bacteria division Kazan-3B-28 TaxID=1798534 RepID=A0A0G1X8I6_UNCK3|nr:MAG: subtilisin-like protein serine protease [candidate division Kazan bacterium GW2011_GWA1_50_15]KKW25886.1 MAG: GLUG domain protein [candidate division Kazan bacterium GW2011_GWC1_52_13]KKW27100.1 MAG: GLUG domain protein [candidate division Kazan bacterium GW2011_GWB1_52_7]HAV65939.1 hypothetical protein [Patescibacteria group bacterium]HCR42389.1 hypothetical protein [Patescibacteria group bacterium]
MVSNRLASKLRRPLSLATAITLALQSIVLGGIFGGNPAMAATATFNFTTPGDYSPTANFAIHGGAAHFKVSWSDTSSGLPTTDPLTDLISPSSAGLAWAATGGTDGAYKSTDYGATWSNISIDANFIPDDFEVTPGDGGSNAVNLFVGGQDSSAAAYAYSTDNGTNWTYDDTTLAPFQGIASVAHKSSATSYTWVLHKNGAISRTEDVDTLMAWGAQLPPAFGTGRQLLWDATDSTLIVSGGNAGTGKVLFSSDNGDNWTAATLPGSPPATIDQMVYSNGSLFVGGSGYVAVGDVSAGLDQAGSWTDVSANINSGNFTTVAGFVSAASGVVLVSVDATTGISNGQVYSTIDDGANWLTHGTPGADVTPGPLVRMFGDGRFLWGLTEDTGAQNEAYLGDFDTDSASVIPLTGISAATLSAIDITYNAKSEETDVGVAFGFGTDPAGTWYYVSVVGGGGDAVWESTTTDDYQKSNTETLLDAELEEFATDVEITGDIYLKIYSKSASEVINDYTHDLFIINQIDVTYTAGTLTVTAPNGGENWTIGSTQDITWDSTGFGGGNIIDIDYSTNAGGGWTSIITNTANDGLYGWIIPNEPSTQALVRISSGSVTDNSNAVFTISAGAGGGQTDNEMPKSLVDPLPPYQTEWQFPVSITATDDIGVKETYLYYSYEGGAVTLWGMDNSAPFTFEFDASANGNGTYQFYSRAVDWSGKDNWPEKLLLGPPVETSTIVDTIRPYIISQIPMPDQTEVAITQDVVVEFSEPMDTATFAYQLYEKDDPTKNVPIVDTEWTNGDTKLTITHADFNYKTWYTFHIAQATDKAGNILLEGTPSSGWGMGGIQVEYPYGTWDFETAPKRDPDLTSSTIVVSEGSHGGKYLPGETAHYTITIRNTSDLPANNAEASLGIADELTGVVGSFTASSGTLQLFYDGSRIVGFHWGGSVAKGTDVVIQYNARVNTPANVLDVEQNIAIDDNVNETFYPAPAILHIAKNPDFTTSTKTVNYNETLPGIPLQYTVTIVHTGNTVVDAVVVDAIPAYTTYIPNSLVGDAGWQTLSYNPTTNRIEAEAQMLANTPPGFGGFGVPEWEYPTLTFTFGVIINDAADGQTISNSATVSDPDVPGSSFTTAAATTVVPGDSKPPDFSPQITSTTPVNGSFSAPLKGSISAQFSKSIKTDTLSYQLTLDGYPVDTTGWQETWTNNDRIWTLTPNGSLEIGAPYTIEITYAEDTDGNTLISGPVANPWDFTTADPMLAITTPTDPLVELTVEQASPVFTVMLQDAISGEPYMAEDDVVVGLGAWIGGTPRTTGHFIATPDGRDYITAVDIPQGQSQAQFYYIDLGISDPNYITITAYENPSRGWGDAEKNAIVRGDVDALENRLVMTIDATNFPAGQFSPAITISAQSRSGQQLSLPGTVYFYTPSDTGRFYDAERNPLPQWLTIQGFNPTTNLQYTQLGTVGSAVFYYRDTTPGAYLVTVADQAPLTPDTGYQNVSAVLGITGQLEELPLEELEEVEDDSGRVLGHVTIQPAQTTLLPGEMQTFVAKGYDTDGKEIKSLVFRWYVLAGGGTILKQGAAGDSHTSKFTAGQKPGVYHDTVLVATMYNDKIDYATADVAVADIVGYGGPARLPTTGISGLQLILLGLTLIAAVALAWVEHYDKTYFQND